ncbi:hypothetical protein A1351_11555 [Methylosinus sp. R-45379]|nr:hypothetical protein A1351_11555 [Methylosinus sp. R-45379]
MEISSVPFDPVEILETRGGRPAVTLRRSDAAPKNGRSLAFSNRPAAPDGGQLLRVGLLLALAALCAGALKAGLGRSVVGAERTADMELQRNIKS